MKLKSRFLLRMAGSVVSRTLDCWMNTLDCRAAYYDPYPNPGLPHDGKSRLFLFWHEYLQLTIYLWKHCNIAMMLSRHADADVLEELAHLFGYDTVRGSTNRHGADAIAGMKKRAGHFDLTMTPDGPRGPRRKMAPGCIFIASRLQIPIILVGVGFDRPWRISSWDRFAIPRPGSRARIVSSEEIFVPPDLNRDGIEHWRVRIESLLNRLTEDAENWAVRGDDIEGASNILPGPKFSTLYFATPHTVVVDESRFE